MSAPHRPASPPADARGAEAGFNGSPLAFRRSTAAFAKALTPWLNFGPRFLELPGAIGRTLPGAGAASPSRTGRSAGRDDARSLPGAGLRSPPAGTASRSASGSSLEGDVPALDIGIAMVYSFLRWLSTEWFLGGFSYVGQTQSGPSTDFGPIRRHVPGRE